MKNNNGNKRVKNKKSKTKRSKNKKPQKASGGGLSSLENFKICGLTSNNIVDVLFAVFIIAVILIVLYVAFSQSNKSIEESSNKKLIPASEVGDKWIIVKSTDVKPNQLIKKYRTKDDDILELKIYELDKECITICKANELLDPLLPLVCYNKEGNEFEIPFSGEFLHETDDGEFIISIPIHESYEQAFDWCKSSGYAISLNRTPAAIEPDAEFEEQIM